MTASVPTVAIIGAGGHGMWHRRLIARREAEGALRLTALVDPAPIEATEDAPVGPGVRIFDDHREMLREAAPDIAVICTPPHTHLVIASDAARAGCDLLLEKPPVTSFVEHGTLSGVLAETGRACQIGFQALGSTALAELREAIAEGRLGRLTAIAVAGAWQRTDSYYSRSVWAGRGTLDGRPVLDGALANPFAHAIAQSLAIAGDPQPVRIEVERYRARAIEVDDTASLRIGLAAGPVITVAVTLCSESFVAGEIRVRGTEGEAVLEYPTDTLTLPGDAAPRKMEGRVELIDNLIAHRADGTPLISPLSRTAAFTTVLDAIRAAPVHLIGDEHLSRDGENITIAGVNAAIEASAAKSALFSEVGAPWGVPAEEPQALWRTGAPSPVIGRPPVRVLPGEEWPDPETRPRWRSG